jgi:hypothetical protein
MAAYGRPDNPEKQKALRTSIDLYVNEDHSLEINEIHGGARDGGIE